MMEELTSLSLVKAHFPVGHRIGFKFGPVSLSVSSNRRAGLGLQWFLPKTHANVHQGSPSDMALVNIHSPLSKVPDRLSALYDSSYRGTQMLRGVYLGHHTGTPVSMIRYGRKFVLFGEQPEYLFWVFF